jgi:hypothetical protein
MRLQEERAKRMRAGGGKVSGVVRGDDPAQSVALSGVEPVSGIRIEEGAACIWFAFDIGQQIDLDRAQRRFAAGTERERILHQRRAPDYLQFQPAPLRLNERAEAIAVGGFLTDGQVESTLYDFGAVSIAYRITLGGHALAELSALAGAIDASPELVGDGKARARSLIDKLGDAVRKPMLADLVEEYTVFHLRRWSGASDPAAVIDENRGLVVQILRAECEALREEEVEESLHSRISYGPGDDLVIDWNGALLLDARGDDTLAVLEFANIELLEMRFLDDRLDEALERSHAALRAGSGLRWFDRLRRGDMRESMHTIARGQIENALLFESVNNAIKLLGDQFLARIYRLAARRLHLEDWDASILRKLETLESIYAKLHDELSTLRMEILEWIVILLILVSILLPFVIGGGH